MSSEEKYVESGVPLNGSICKDVHDEPPGFDRKENESNNNNKDVDLDVETHLNEQISKEDIPPDESQCDEITIDDKQRNKLFQLGAEYEQDGQPDYALKYYLKSLSNLNGNTRFVFLPQCLRNVADIYFEREQYETAIHFVQAEKLYYENALVNNTELQQKLEQLQSNPSAENNSESDDRISLNSRRADEYEQLSLLCLDKNQYQLALEYAGKATKIRQQLYGDEHSVTKDSLDFFAKVYAEVGKQDYSDSLRDFSEDPESVNNNNEVNTSDKPKLRRQGSILRQKSKSDGDSPKKKVHFNELHERHIYEREHEAEDQASRMRTWFGMLMWSLILTILFLYLYCRFIKSDVCSTIKSDLYYFYTRLKYRYYHYSATKNQYYG